ncbi:hypothetical protein STRAU_5451 [Streptomyces aurantiacus JA 4570]|uniref:Uncharacterized protein n=1 Tax=Streptomyces aurantiacus JA 4570 TaxID=1286094 RepID=S3ZFR9_9ACTN|nr:hypothetical protein STRAU_5451 [Streptomyces aurantiacus JA 4570]
MAIDPLVLLTRSTLPNWITATGSRPRNDTTGRAVPVSATTCRYASRVARAPVFRSLSAIVGR